MIERKIAVFLLMFAILVVIHYILDIVKLYRGVKETKEKTWKDYLILGTSISYILTIIFTGINLW